MVISSCRSRPQPPPAFRNLSRSTRTLFRQSNWINSRHAIEEHIAPETSQEPLSKHVVSFKNLSLGATDLDGLIEYHQLCYVLFELKYGDAIPPEGQRIALVRMCDDLQRV